MILRTLSHKYLKTAFLAVVALAAAVCLFASGEQAYAESNGKPVLVALGDSYSAGEGVEPFMYQWDGDNKYSHDEFIAHQSEKAWSGNLTIDGHKMNEPGEQWYFRAASGAETKHFYDEKQHKNWTGGGNGRDLELQCKVFEEEKLKGLVDYVTFSIGGNDLGFARIVELAAKNDIPFLSEGDYKPVLKAGINTFNTGFREKLMSLYQRVWHDAGDQSYVIVAGYPHLFPREGVKVNEIWGIVPTSIVGIDAAEAKDISDAVDLFNLGMKSKVANNANDHIRYVDVSGSKYFGGHEGEYMHPIYKDAKDQDLEKDKASAYSVHPNEQGANTYARAVQDEIDRIESEKAKKGESSSKSAASPVTTDLAMSLVFDVSGSMNDSAGTGASKLDAAKTQSTAFINTINKTGTESNGGISVQVGVAAFASNLEGSLPLSTDPTEINGTINGLIAFGRTNIYAGLAEGIEQVKAGTGEKMIVLLSDGLSNQGPGTAEILDLARTANDEGIKVFTIGFGEARDIDEPLLQEIADITGGTYSHEDATQLSAAAVGLFGVMKSAQMSAAGNVVLNETGTVASGQTADVGQFVVEEPGTLTAYLYWPGSMLDMILLDPKGVEVKDGYPGYSIDTSSIPTTITIENAAAGTWNMAVFGRDVSMPNEPFWVGSVLTPSLVQTPTANVGGGGSADNSGGLVILLVVVAVAAIGGVYALSVRKKNEG